MIILLIILIIIIFNKNLIYLWLNSIDKKDLKD